MKKNEKYFYVCIIIVLAIATASLAGCYMSACDGYKRVIYERNGLQNKVYNLEQENSYLRLKADGKVTTLQSWAAVR